MPQVRRFIMRRRINRIIRRYAELRADPDEWASYQAEARLADNVVTDLRLDAREEHPEYNG
jgi:hypothetical protein